MILEKGHQVAVPADTCKCVHTGTRNSSDRFYLIAFAGTLDDSIDCCCDRLICAAAYPICCRSLPIAIASMQCILLHVTQGRSDLTLRMQPFMSVTADTYHQRVGVRILLD